MHDALDRPHLHARQQLAVQVRRIALEESEGALREHHAEAESDLGGVLLHHLHRPSRKAALDEQGEQQSCRSGSEDQDAHLLELCEGVCRNMLAGSTAR